MTRRISIFGSTGSVGCNTVDLLKRQGGAEAYDVAALTCSGNVELLAEQARALDADYAITADDAQLLDLRAALEGSGTKAMAGQEALLEAARIDVDWAMSSIVGAAGLKPTMELAEHASTLALANKESLVCAGELLLERCATHQTRLLPVDSEHSAIFQALGSHPKSELRRILLTASGGPFRTWSLEKMTNATRKEALNHPNWDMGERITIDSASMFNKALEVVEAKYLFDVSAEQIEVIVHPQSIVHSMVEFCDGAVLAQLGVPDMRGPIGFALNYPDRAALPVEPLDFASLARLDFEPPDETRFPSLRLAKEALAAGGAMGAVLNAAKEVALDAFLAGNMRFLAMAELVERTMEALEDEARSVSPGDGIDTVFLLDERARAVARDGLASSELGKAEVV